jgi:hypothetical protein
MTRRSLRRLSWMLVGALLYAQAAIALYACPLQATTLNPGLPVMAGASLVHDAPASAAPALMADCHGMSAATDPSSASLCAEHCQFGQQSNQAPTLSVPVAILTALYVAPQLPEPTVATQQAGADPGALAAASPPHAILHCTFRI